MPPSVEHVWKQGDTAFLQTVLDLLSLAYATTVWEAAVVLNCLIWT